MLKVHLCRTASHQERRLAAECLDMPLASFFYFFLLESCIDEPVATQHEAYQGWVWSVFVLLGFLLL